MRERPGGEPFGNTTALVRRVCGFIDRASWLLIRFVLENRGAIQIAYDKGVCPRLYYAPQIFSFLVNQRVRSGHARTGASGYWYVPVLASFLRAPAITSGPGFRLRRLVL